MPIAKLTDPSKTINSPVDYDTVNSILAYLKTLHDVFTLKHTTVGAHDDDILTRGWGKVTFSGSTPTLVSSTGIVASISDQGIGKIRVELSVAASTADDMDPNAQVHHPGGNYHAVVSVVDTDTFDVYLLDAGSEASLDVDFSFNVRIQ